MIVFKGSLVSKGCINEELVHTHWLDAWFEVGGSSCMSQINVIRRRCDVQQQEECAGHRRGWSSALLMNAFNAAIS